MCQNHLILKHSFNGLKLLAKTPIYWYRLPAMTGEKTMALEKEIATYEANLETLKVQEGKFVLINGDQIVDVFASYEDAIKEGYQKFGLTPFLVRQIRAIQNVHFITRFVEPRPAEAVS